jgi:hypothetical protein
MICSFFEASTVLAMQYNEEGSFIERMKKGDITGVY